MPDEFKDQGSCDHRFELVDFEYNGKSGQYWWCPLCNTKEMVDNRDEYERPGGGGL